MRGKRLSLVGLLQAAAIVTVAFSFVTIFDSAHRLIALFSHFRLQYLGVSLSLLIVFAILRQARYGVLLSVAVAVNASYVVPWYLGATGADASDAITLMNANVFARNDSYERLTGLIDAERPDVILLQEISPDWLAALQSIQGDYPFSYAEPRLDAFGIAIFSRLPFESVHHVDSPPLGYPTLVATLIVNGQAVTLVNTHAMAPLTPSGFEARNEQLRSVARIAKAVHGALILAGDFNTSMWSPAYRELEKTTGLSSVRRGRGVLPTWPTFMPFAMIPIDHILVSDEIRVVETRRGAHFGSDHLPLIVSFAVGG